MSGSVLDKSRTLLVSVKTEMTCVSLCILLLFINSNYVCFFPRSGLLKEADTIILLRQVSDNHEATVM